MIWFKEWADGWFDDLSEVFIYYEHVTFTLYFVGNIHKKKYLVYINIYFKSNKVNNE